MWTFFSPYSVLYMDITHAFNPLATLLELFVCSRSDSLLSPPPSYCSSRIFLARALAGSETCGFESVLYRLVDKISYLTCNRYLSCVEYTYALYPRAWFAGSGERDRDRDCERGMVFEDVVGMYSLWERCKLYNDLFPGSFARWNLKTYLYMPIMCPFRSLQVRWQNLPTSCEPAILNKT